MDTLTTIPQSSNVLMGLNFNNLEEFMTENFENLDFKKNQLIFSEKNTPYGIFYISKGRVKISKIGSDGKEQIIKIAKPGDFLGYAEILGGTKYTTSASSLEEVQLNFIPKEDFLDVLKYNQELSEGFFRLVCKDLMEVEEKMTDIAYKPVRGRLAEALLSLNETYEVEKGLKSVIPISREDLARMVGTAKETVIRLLSEFKTENIIKTEGRKITILNPQGLVGLSNLYN